MNRSNFLRWCALPIGLCLSLAPLSARAGTDACMLATSAQIGAAIHTAVGAGKHVTPTFVKTCTWLPTGNSGIRAVTVNLPTVPYDGSRRMAERMAAMSPHIKVEAASVGNEGYYLVEGEIVQLFFRKGNTSVKVVVYARMPADELEAMELAIARQVATQL